MAAQTIILRPVLIDTLDSSLVSFVPETEITSAHMLLNEEIADDDATYAICSAGGNINYYFDYSRPDNMGTIIGISVKIRCKLESSKTNKSLSNSITISSKFTANQISNITNDYVEYELTFKDIKSIINELNVEETKRISLNSSISSGTKNSPIRITQIYIEIKYASLYQKINGIWEYCDNFQIYTHSNNSWELRDITELSDGQHYRLRSN